jgi:hypothetical protein
LDPDGLEVKNTSESGELETTNLFKSFYKSSLDQDHIGLGLSIIRQICDASGFRIHYSFDAGMHSFHISWNKG